MPFAVYEITCSGSGRSYIGSSRNVSVRWRNHLWQLKRGKHVCKLMQEDYRKYGRESFSVSTLKECESEAEARSSEVEEIRERLSGGLLYNRKPAGVGRTALPAGMQREYAFCVRFRPQVIEATREARERLSRKMGREVTLSELLRIAVWEYCKEPDDPREP